LQIVRAAGEDVEAAVALFHDIDADGSGELDEEEFTMLLQSMGK
jgi:Ca2+-binding EF-hand superfamily protein